MYVGDYRDLIKALRPTKYAVPDVIRDPVETTYIWNNWERVVGPSIPMFVIQPVDEDGVGGYSRLKDKPKWVALPKVWQEKRIALAVKIKINNWMMGHVEGIHAFGFTEADYLRELGPLSLSGVSSIDSNVPITRGLQGVSLQVFRVENGQALKPGGLEGFTTPYVGYAAGNSHIAQSNLAMVDWLCKSGM